jgi:hypothetical protein
MPALSALTLGGTTLAAAGLAGSALLASPATDPDPLPSTPRERLTATCSRLSDRIERVGRAQERLAGGTEVMGSVARLQARIDRARGAGHDDAVRLLEDRMAIRKDVAAMVPEVLTHLRDAQQVCSEHEAGS